MLIFYAALIGCETNIKETVTEKGDNLFIKSIYKDEKLKYEQQFFKNEHGKLVASGYAKEYYDNEHVFNVINFFDDKLIGNQIRYDETGNEQKIAIISERGVPHFEMIRIGNGDFELKGIPLQLNAPGNPVKKGEEYIIYYGIITTANFQTLLIRKFTNPSGKTTLNDTITDFIPIDKEYFVEKVAFNDTGNYLITIDVTLFERKSNRVITHGHVVDTFHVIK